MYELGQQVSGGEYMLAVTGIQRASRQIAAFFQDYDAWISVEVFDYSPGCELIATECIRYMRETLSSVRARS